MASTSKFIQLTDYLLLEYLYDDPVTPTEYSQNVYRIVNNHQAVGGAVQILNTDGSTAITGNVRSRSCMQVSGGQYVDLDPTQVPTFMDLDVSQGNMTYTTLGPPVTTDVPYDRCRVHLLSGYNFPNLDGVIFQVQAAERSGKNLTLCSLAFLKNSPWFTFDPNPLFLGDRYYDRYFDVWIPSVYLTNNIYYQLQGSPSQALTFVANVTSDGGGFLRGNPLIINAIEISSTQTQVINSQQYDVFMIGSTASATINQSDEFGLIGATIQPSSAGDYYEFFATYDSGFIQDYLINANSLPGNDYIVINQLVVTEQIGSINVQTAMWQGIQTTNFDQPNTFRPIIVNAATAFSFTITYSMRLYNQADASQIIRVASLTDNNPKAWGPQLDRIALLDAPQPQKVYNEVVAGPTIQAGSIINNVPPVQPYTTVYVPTFYNLGFIGVGQDSVFMDQNGQLASAPGPGIRTVYGQGQLNIVITPFDNFLKFTIFQTVGPNGQPLTTPTPLNLSGNGVVYNVVFQDNSGNLVRYQTFTDPVIADPSKGDLLFKIPESAASTVLTYTTQEFWISNTSPDGIETPLYQGLWNQPQNIQAAAASNANVQATQASGIQSQINDIVTTQQNQQAQINQAKALTPGQAKAAASAVFEVPGVANDVATSTQTSIISNITPAKVSETPAATLATEQKLQQQINQPKT